MSRAAVSVLPDRVSVAVVGAGPTGLSVAALLAQAGVEVVVLERDFGLKEIPRAIVIDDEGLRMLQSLGLHGAALDMTRAAHGARYYDEMRRPFAETGRGEETYGFPKRNYLHQPDLERLLAARLEELAPGALRFSHEVGAVRCRPDHVELSIIEPGTAPRILRADWLLACDGGRSPIRAGLGIELEGETYGQDWVVLDTIDDPDNEPVSKFFCDAGRPHVSIPAPRGGRRYEFMVLPGEDGAKLLRDAELGALLAPFRRLQPETVLRRALYTFHARIAARWREGRVFLMGDAAHLTPPFAGQGMNAGLRDAHNLAWKLALVVHARASAALLDSYEAERRAPAWAMIQLAVAMGKLVMPRGPEEAALRAAMVQALEPFPAVRDYLLQMRFKPRPRYATGVFLDLDNQPFEASLVGEMLPQPELRTGGATRRLDSIAGPGFALIAQDAAGAAALARPLGLPWARLAPVCLDLSGAPGGMAPAPGDPRARALRTHRDQIILLRPDRYVAAAFAPSAMDATASRLAALLAG